MRLLLLLTVLFTGCAQAQPLPEVEPDRTFILSLDESARVLGGPEVTFLGIEQDSRCPANVQCVWAGEAIALFRLAVGGRATEIRVAVPGGQMAGSSASLSSGSLLIERLGPYPGTREARELAPVYVRLRFVPAWED